MNLSECLKQLSFGELANTSWGVSGTGAIKEEKIPATVHFINEALLRLYSRFLLKKKSLHLEMYDGITKYHLTSEHAFSNKDSDKVKYIFDTEANPFMDDIIKVMAVNTTVGAELPLNNPIEPWSVFTPEYNILEVPRPLRSSVLVVHYQAKHPELTPDNLEAEIDLPFVLEGALKAYVAYQVYSNMNAQEAVGNAQKHLAIFQSILQEATEQDVVSITYSQTNTKFRRNGWV